MRIDVARFYVDTARIYLAGGNRQPAERLLVRANRMDETNFDALQALAFLASQDGKIFEAIKWMKDVTSMLQQYSLAKMQVWTGEDGLVIGRAQLTAPQ